MAFLSIVLGSFIGTSLMTLYSYLVAEIREKQFKEPVLLNELLARSDLFPRHLSTTSWWGWGIHYSIGLTFVVGYHLLWQYSPLIPSYFQGALMGAASGVIGIGGWKMMFKINENPPLIDIKEYYVHLMVAHIIFGVGAVAGYRWLGA